MRTLVIPLILTACLPTIPVGDPAEKPSGEVPVDHGIVENEAFGDEVDALMVPIIETGGVNVSVALVKHDRVVFTGAYGWADVASGNELTVDTPMSMGSVSKTFIGIAAMQAVEAGSLNLDDNISDLVGFPVDNPKVEGESITLRHLLTHNSGLVDSREYDLSYDVGDPTVPLDVFSRGYVTEGGEYYRSGNFAKRPPNDKFSYTNVGASLAALGIAGATQREYANAVTQDILEPLGMTNSGYFLTDLPTPPATLYDNKMRPYERYGFPTYPDGLMRSSANDMGRYIAMVQGNGTFDGVSVLTSESVEEMLTVDPALGTDEDGQAIIWAQLGWMEDRPLFGHSGGDPGVGAILALDRESGAGMVVMVNSDSTDFDVAFAAIPRLFELVDGLELSR